MKVLQFYTSTGARDAERIGSPNGLLCPDWRVLPFQIQRPHTGAGSLTSALLVDCSGNTTSILSSLTIDVNQRTTYDFLTYKGQAFDEYLDYGVYYIQASDGNATWYSEWMTIQPIQNNLLTGWDSTAGWSVFTATGAGSYSGVDIAIATSASTATGWTNPFSVRKGEEFYLTSEYNETDGSPEINFYIVAAGGGATISNEIEPSDGVLQTNKMTAYATDSAAQLRLVSAGGAFTVERLSLRRVAGDYCYIKFDNTKDIQGQTTLNYALTPECESILYASGWEQEIYLDTYLNNPAHEIVEVGDEKNGVFEAEKVIDKYIYNIISYESRSVVNAMRILPLHDGIKIYDEVGNLYQPDQGNVRVGWDWGTFDTNTLRIDFNESGTVWTNNMDNIA